MPNLGPNNSPQTPQGGSNESPSHRSSGSPIYPRGISYPPLSPKSSLRRSKALPSSQQKSPLIKSRPVTSDGITIPVITTGTPRSNCGHGAEDEDEQKLEEKTLPKAANAGGLNEDKQPLQPRKGRNDHRGGTDTRRYHTAGAIEDIKVNNGYRKKFTQVIRLSHYSKVSNKRTVQCTLINFLKKSFLYALIKDL